MTTPAKPWIVQSLNGRHTLFNEETGITLPINGSMRTSIDDERKANARFVAAQLNAFPALYAALEDIEDFVSKHDNPRTIDELKRSILDWSRAALSLARGGVVDGQGAGVDSGRGEKGGA